MSRLDEHTILQCIKALEDCHVAYRRPKNAQALSSTELDDAVWAEGWDEAVADSIEVLRDLIRAGR